MMKKVYLLMAALMLLTGNYMMAQTQRTVLVEEFTQASCPHCPPANAYLNPLFAANQGNVVAIKYQVDWPGVDTMNLQDPGDPNTRVNLYGIGNIGVPDAVLDGDTSKLSDDVQAYNGYPYLITQDLLNSELAVPSPVSMTATYAYNSTNDSVFSTIVVKNVSGGTFYASAHTNLKLFISLLEMNIHFVTNPPGDNGEYDFYYVNRKMYPSANGFTLPDSIVNGDSVIYQLRVKAPAYIYNTKEMAVAAFVQDMGGMKPVQQAVLATPANVTDNIMTDITTYPTPAPVCNLSFTPALTLTNNSTTVTLTSATVGYVVPGYTTVSQPWTGSLTPGQSTNISLPTVTVPGNTYTNFSYFVNNLNGGTLIDANDANNTPQTAFFSTVPATATMDTLSEQFEEGFGYVATPISTNSTDPNDEFGFTADQNFITNYLYGASETSTAQCGGYGLSDASFMFFLADISNYGQQDGLIFDPVTRVGATANLLTFDHAYAPISGSNDELNVEISTDCGATWTSVWDKTGAAFATSPSVDINSEIFTPSATQWVTDSVDVSAYNGNNDVIVQFLCTSQGGNALYIDNINWGLKAAPTAVQQLSNNLSVSLYPNPASDQVNLNLSLTQSGSFDITVVNTLGQTVKSVFEGQMGAGTNNQQINVADLASGLYNVVIKSNDQVVVKRFFVTK